MAAAGLEDGDMRLADGGAANRGRVEIFYGGRWGTVCHDKWDLTDADVVCRALGFKKAVQALGGAAFGPGVGPIMLDDVECTGAEQSLAQCQSLGWLLSNCLHKEDASVVCSNETRDDPVAHTLDLSSELPQALAALFTNQVGCDLSVQVQAGDEEALTVCVHRMILSTNPEAQALLREPGHSITMEVDAECVPVVMDFIRYLYSRRLDVPLSSVKCFHQLASTHGAERLQEYCARLFAVVLPQDASFRTALDLHAYALATRDPTLEALCVRFLAWNFEALTRAAAWPSVEPALLRALLARSELAVSSELALLQALQAWGADNRGAGALMAGLLEEVRFPMILPADLSRLQLNASQFGAHRELLQKKTSEALQFHTAPRQQLARQGANLARDAYRPRLYTAPAWGASMPAGPQNSRLADPSAGGALSSSYGAGAAYPLGSADQGYYPSRAFTTPQHPSFLFRATRLSWSLFYLPTVQSCRSRGLTCSAGELPALGLTRSGRSDPAVGYENKALMLCSNSLVGAVTDFTGQKAPIPGARRAPGPGDASVFPCPRGYFSSFHAVIRPFYLTNSSGVHQIANATERSPLPPGKAKRVPQTPS
ncbi:galectin-3-binding protein [Orycteropus afer afer]|uniref:Galectin-3-binding protein n=1 Tax=Orycteropus afer afer TaxID=1230840 RepID=A0A8B7BCY2_ORYAF|nr:galectin-3-binding protein [Orycteropus afer afer]